MVELTDGLDRRRLLEALDETPQTAERLARRLDMEAETVREALATAEEDGVAADWGELWATTWRAKVELAPRFFRVWIPASVAIGAGLTALGLGLHAPASVRWEAAAGLGVVAVLGAGLALAATVGSADG